MRFRLPCLALALMPAICFAQQKEVKWDVNNPPGNYREISFSTDEGTWMNLDVSPDGKEIVFDLLGDIYTLPIAGGNAQPIRTGLAFEVQPRYSPDGKSISFTSDAGGGDNIWTMNRDGSNAKQVTTEDFRLLNNAVWAPSGDFLVGRKHFTSTRSLGAGELWMYHISGGEGMQLTKRKNEQQDLGEPCYSPDGKFIYYSEDMYPGGYFQYNKNPNEQIYAIKRFDTENGETETVTGGEGGAFRPQVSRDGKLLSFVRRVREKSVLFIRDLQTGEEWPVYDQLSKDQQEAWAIFGVYPNFAWMPGNEEIIIWSQGKINRISVSEKKATGIPFTVNCNHKLAETVRFEQQAAPDSFEVKVPRHMITSPDEKYIVFSATGYLWKKMLPDGKPVRLTKGKDFESEPAFDNEGKRLVFVTWNDEAKGAIMTIDPSKPGSNPVKITSEKGIYRTPQFSPDGKSLVYHRENGNDHLGFTHSVRPGIFIMPAAGGKSELISKEGQTPYFSTDGKKIFYFHDEGEKKALKSITIDTREMLTHFTSKYATSIVPSPDNKWVAFIEFFKVYISVFAPSGKTSELAGGSKSMPVSQTALHSGLSLHWSRDSKKIHWTTGDEYFSKPVPTGSNF